MEKSEKQNKVEYVKLNPGYAQHFWSSGNGFTIAEAVLQAIADSCKVINLSIVMNGSIRIKRCSSVKYITGIRITIMK